jgi:hypothetical protein
MVSYSIVKERREKEKKEGDCTKGIQGSIIQAGLFVIGGVPAREPST